MLEEHEQKFGALRQALIDGEKSGDAGELDMTDIKSGDRDGTLVFVLRQDGRNKWPPVEFAASLKDGYIDVEGTRCTVRIESRNNVLVVSGLGSAKKPYRWRNGDPLSAPRAELPLMNDNSGRHLVTEVQRLMERLSLVRAG